MLESLGALWVAGCSVAWDQVYPTRRTAVALPSYPWQRQRYWDGFGWVYHPVRVCY